MQLSFILAVLAVVTPSQAFFCEYQQWAANYGTVARYLVRIYQANALSGFCGSCWNDCNNNGGCLGWTWEYNRKSNGELVLAKCVFYWQYVMTWNEQVRSNEGKMQVRDRSNYYGSDYSCGAYYFQNGKYWKIVKKSETSNDTIAAFADGTTEAEGQTSDSETVVEGKADEDIINKRWSQANFPLVNYANPDSTNWANPNDYFQYYYNQLGWNQWNYGDVWI